MNRKPDNEELLADVFAEAGPADLRAAMLGETLRLVRRRRRWRQARHVAGMFFVLGLLMIFVRRKNPPRPPVSAPPMATAVSENYKLVRTQPLPAGAIVTTGPLRGGQFIAPAAGVEIVQTAPGNFRIINDAELLALVAQKPAILIRTGPNSEELVFANPEDQNSFR
jgi:hypothetical protein